MSCITGIGTAVPEHRYQQQELFRLMSNLSGLADTPRERWLKAIYHYSGINTRYSVLPDFGNNGFKLFSDNFKDDPCVSARMELFNREAPGLALKATANLFHRLQQDQTDFDPQDITHLITVTCTGLSAPGLEITLMEELGLKNNTQRFAVNFMGCYAAFPALRIADSICRADKNAVVLISSTELCTIHFQNKKDEDSLLANALFSDGSAALLVTSCEKAKRDFGKKLRIDQFESACIGKGKDEMAWQVGPNGFNMKLTSYVPDLLEEGFGPLVEGIKTKLTDKDFTTWAIHPGGRRILDLCKQSLKLNGHLDPSYKVLRDFGNMSSATVLFVLKELWDNMDWNKNTDMLAAGFGPGLTMETMSLSPLLK